MASKFIITEKKRQSTPTGHYEKESEHRMELRRISAVEKELKHHEAQGLDKAHKGGSQKSAPLPSMRSY